MYLLPCFRSSYSRLADPQKHPAIHLNSRVTCLPGQYINLSVLPSVKPWASLASETSETQDILSVPVVPVVAVIHGPSRTIHGQVMDAPGDPGFPEPTYTAAISEDWTRQIQSPSDGIHTCGNVEKLSLSAGSFGLYIDSNRCFDFFIVHGVKQTVNQSSHRSSPLQIEK